MDTKPIEIELSFTKLDQQETYGQLRQQPGTVVLRRSNGRRIRQVLT